MAGREVFLVTDKVISLKDVRFKYKGSGRWALDGVSLEVAKGECVAVLGPTGSGKSTLCGVMNGTVPLFLEGDLQGDVVVDGMVPARVGTAKMAAHVGLVFGDPDMQLFGMTVEEDVAFGPANLGLDYRTIMERVRKSLVDMRLAGFERRAPYRLSGGEKQATAIAGVYAMLPDIMVLDEPTSMLDPQGKARVFEIIRRLKEELGITVVLVEQEVDDVLQLADRVFVMGAGRFVLQGTPREVFSRVAEVAAAGVRVPHLVQFGTLLQAEKVPFTLDEAVELVERGAWRKADNVSAGEGQATAQDRQATCVARSAPSESVRIKPGNALIEVKELEHVYPQGSVALRGVSLTVKEGEFVAIVGQNGAGKTTLTRHLNGLLKPTRGDVRIGGRSIKDLTAAQVSRTVGYVFQNPDEQLFCNSVEEELRFGPSNIGLIGKEIDERVQEILEDIGLAMYRDVWPKYLTKGERQKLALASVVAMDPAVLIVDEPTTGLDWSESLQIMDYLKRLGEERGKTILIITHDMNIVSLYARRVVVMARGRVVGDGSPREVFSDCELMAEANLKPPAIAELSTALCGLVALTPEEAVEAFMHLEASREGLR
ncbi:MAG: energy-coupling factor transporter ATPase [Firmicutes bacterium]|nr:energy-coupling factor transporter ATPase [Bacillota bacterium]MDH7495297.1 energy-coupling factor transporter ATPase [Bacillota bacterium]